MLADFATFVAGQWKVISNALPTFILAVLVCGGIVWMYARHYFFGRITALKERIDLRDDQLANIKKQLGADSPSDALVKLGALTERIEALSIGKWGRLTEGQIQKFRAKLIAIAPTEISIQLDDDARALGYAIDKVFGDLGWNIHGIRCLGGSAGIHINPKAGEGDNQKIAEAVAEALRAAGLTVEVSGGGMESLTLYLGGKPYYD